MLSKLDYKATLNLPKTDFPMKANLPSKEPDILRFWIEKDVYSLIRRKRNGRKKYILHDGPPYANGHIHMGHALNKILKDIVVKYMNMQGFDSAYIPGWDCHGLPVEHQLFKELNIGKDQIDQLDFRKKAHDYAMKFVNIQCEEFQRLGVLGDWKNPYLTLSYEYESQVIKSFAKLVKQNYIYKDLKPVNWCTTCETALAEAEVEYEERVSPSVYVKFKVKSANEKLKTYNLKLNTYFIIWTTTPWTLLANVAIAVHPDMDYVIIDVEDEQWILLESLADITLKKIGKTYKILSKVKGKGLEGIIATHPFIDRESRVVLADYVSSFEGTGCVHTAPGHGQEDYITGKEYDLELIMPVDEKGNFNNTCGEFSGMNVHKANAKIIERMKKDRTLIYNENITHSYPHCWRCKKPIIFRATKQWFMKIDHKSLRKKLLEIIKSKVKWYPDVGKDRISAMVSDRPDWCLSRQRYWGVPIPAFYCMNCGHTILEYDLVMHIADLVLKEGTDIWFKESAAKLLPKAFCCPRCRGNDLEKENDILDVWFESGVSHQAVLKIDKALDYPCELYLEGSDQHRGWFQSALIAAVAIDNKPPYKAVLTHGFTVDARGKKMSKSQGNVVQPQDVMKKYGADILRLWAASSNYSDDVRISDEIIKRAADAYKKIRNTLRYLLSSLCDFNPDRDRIGLKDCEEIDRWMLSRLGYLFKSVTENYSKFVFHKVYRLIYNFCVYEVSSLYLDVLKDRMYTFKKDSPRRRSGQTVIFEILNYLVRLLAPILSFTTEEVWQHAPFLRETESVHLSDWPSQEEDPSLWIDADLEDKWEPLIRVREAVLKAIEDKRIEKFLGSSLEAKVILRAQEGRLKKILKENIDLLPTLFIVSQVELKDQGTDSAKAFHDLGITVEIQHSDGKKCLRCWNYSTSVGENLQHPDICKKCLDNI